MPTKNIDEYISNFPRDIQKILQKIRRTIKNAAPEASETMGYGVPSFMLKEKLVYFAAFNKHIGFYPTPSAIEKFKKELYTYETSKGTVKFPIDKSIPYSLIERIVKFRVSEILKKD